MTGDLSLFLVFTAGLLSFVSPCVLPLIPSYLSILGGVGISTRPRLLLTSAGFILGFSAVFIAMGIVVSTTFLLMGGVSRYINIAAGIIVIVLGLNIIFDFLSFLNYEKRPFFQKQMSSVRGIASAFIAGVAFGAGWTPCIGPVLTGVLLLAGQGGQTGRAAFFLAAYSAGLALPFLFAALFFGSFLKHGSRLRSHILFIRRLSGAVLIIIGIMILTGSYSALNIAIQKQVFGFIDWAQTKALPFRLLARALAWVQNF